MTEPTRVPEETVELDRPPRFRVGDKVQALQMIRSDGTVAGTNSGDIIVEAGAVGYVSHVGEYLQRYYIYAVDFYEQGRIIGMRGHEIAVVEASL